MNGAIAELPPSTSNIPINNRTKISGANHHFFRAFIKAHKSLIKSKILFFKGDKFLLI